MNKTFRPGAIKISEIFEQEGEEDEEEEEAEKEDGIQLADCLLNDVSLLTWANDEQEPSSRPTRSLAELSRAEPSRAELCCGKPAADREMDGWMKEILEILLSWHSGLFITQTASLPIILIKKAVSKRIERIKAEKSGASQLTASKQSQQRRQRQRLLTKKSLNRFIGGKRRICFLVSSNYEIAI